MFLVCSSNVLHGCLLKHEVGVEIYNQTVTCNSAVDVKNHQGRYLDSFPMGSRSVQDYFTNMSLNWPVCLLSTFVLEAPDRQTRHAVLICFPRTV